MRKRLEIAKQGLNDLKNDVIGIFKVGNKYELIIKCNEDTVDTICITNFGIIQECYNIPKHYGTVILFEDGKKMDEILRNPFEWVEYIEKFDIK